MGIPSVLNRFIPQAILQILQRCWDPAFLDNSCGFRPRRSAHQAIAKAQVHSVSDHGVVVDIDLAAFFDLVDHDRLMSGLARDIEDKRLLKLIRRFLQAGILENGLITVPIGDPHKGGSCLHFYQMLLLINGTRSWKGESLYRALR